MALNYDAISALVRKKRIPELVDNYFNAHPLGALLREHGAIEPFTDGGNRIVEPLIIGGLANAGSYDAYDVMTYDTNMPVTAAEYKIKHIVVPIIVAHTEENQVHGENALESFLDAKFQVAKLTFDDLFAKQLYGDGTGNSGKDLDGLGATLSQTSTYGGISPTDFAGWKAQIVTGTTPGTPEPGMIKRMMSLWTMAVKGNDHPDLILVGRKGYLAYWDEVSGRITTMTDAVQKMASLGFETLEFHGVPVVYDPYLDMATASQFQVSGGYSSALVMLNTKYLKLRPTSASHFEHTDWRQADNQIAMKSELLWDGNLTCSNRQRQGLLQDIAIANYV
ncbi:MAG: phage major capsid protein [Bacillota bacterium]|nr:phage major capsid protein [Bacillota bacterium]